MTKLRALIGLIFIAILVYCGLWYTAAFKAEKTTARELADLRDKGLKVEHGKIKLSGFPYRIVLTIDGIGVKTRGPGMEFGADSVTLISHLWTPGHWMMEGRNVVASFADDAVAFKDGYMRASYKRHADKQAVIVVDSYKTDDFVLEAAPALEKPQSLKEWQLYLRYDGTAEPTDGLYEKRFLDFKLVMDSGNRLELMGGVMGPPLFDWTRGALGAWRDAGGLLELDSIDIAVRGARVKGNASLTLDENFMPLGSASLAIAGGPALADYLTSLGFEDASSLTEMGSQAESLSVMAQMGQLNIGSSPVAMLEPIIDE
ncbi:DUF2125 domain-containing protein [Kordiimonas aestuarii]|uniref:DUF2125 domain-containing protein n=1 Tax=Kordiimonas aestuarii TaxID=1005925 RepID=UPI0021D2FECB|nr:DUF2125 domain-containing protein [Kordiimonas aestuarii]